MSLRPDAWMPIYWGDYVRDTGHLNNAGHGAYLMLIKHYWNTGEPLTDDDNELWRIACCDSKKEWMKLRPKIVRLFIFDHGKLRHKRIEAELTRACAITSAKAEAGKKGAEVRWQNDGRRIAAVKNSHRQTDTPSQSPKKEPELRSDGVPPLDPKKELWNDGLKIVRVLTNQDAGPARKFLGRLVNLANADHAKLLALLKRAEIEQPDQPQAWLVAAAAAINVFDASSDLFADNLPPGVTTEASTGKLVAGGIYLEQVADAACDAARISLSEAKRHWPVIAEWGNADLTMFQIVSGIKRLAERPGYAPPSSMKYFDRAVREQRDAR